MKPLCARLMVLVAGFLFATAAHASFHIMQIEQVIGGVNGDGTAQAIQLRMRALGQNQVQNARLVVRDASGANPVVVVDMTHTVHDSLAGDRVLIMSTGMSSYVSVTPDFTLTNIIPPSYFAAGSLTFEDDFGTVYWRLSWGGASYTGPGTLSITNDADGNANPPFPGPLPTTSTRALLFNFGFGAPSTTNANDYQLTADAAVFTNNLRQSATVTPVASVGGGPETDGVALGRPSPNPVPGTVSYTVTLPRETHVFVSVYDVRGRRVARVLDETLGAGHHAFTWDTRRAGVRTGSYYLRLEAGSIHQSRKFSVIR